MAISNDLLIRPMTADDLPHLNAVLDATGLFPPGMLPDMAVPFLHSGRDLWLVAQQGIWVIGFAFCEPERMTEGTWNLLAIAVLPDRQGRGVGGALVAGVESRLAGRGGRLLLVETSGLPEYARTRAFYAARGFVEEARIRDFYSAGEDKLVFRKRLAAG